VPTTYEDSMFADTWCPVPASPSSSSSPASDTRLEGRRDTAREVALLLITDVAREVAMVLILVTSFTLGRSDAESNGALWSVKRVLPGNQIHLPAWCCTPLCPSCLLGRTEVCLGSRSPFSGLLMCRFRCCQLMRGCHMVCTVL
jgi:hypothetical protein